MTGDFRISRAQPPCLRDQADTPQVNRPPEWTPPRAIRWALIESAETACRENYAVLKEKNRAMEWIIAGLAWEGLLAVIGSFAGLLLWTP